MSSQHLPAYRVLFPASLLLTAVRSTTTSLVVQYSEQGGPRRLLCSAVCFFGDAPYWGATLPVFLMSEAARLFAHGARFLCHDRALTQAL